MDSCWIDNLRIQHAEVIRSKFMQCASSCFAQSLFMQCASSCFAQSFRHRECGQSTRISWVAHDANAAILRNGAGSPAFARVGREPRRCACVRCVIGIEQRDEYIDVQQRTHQYASSSRSLSIPSLLTTRARFAKGRNPYSVACARDFDGSGGEVNPRRASSEKTSPVIFFSRRARSLAACRTSSAISNVVRMHQMLVQQDRPCNAICVGAADDFYSDRWGWEINRRIRRAAPWNGQIYSRASVFHCPSVSSPRPMRNCSGCTGGT